MSVFLRDQIMRVMQGHKGRENAMPRKVLLAELRLYRPALDEVQEFKAYIAKAWGPIQAYRRCATIYSFYPQLAPPAEQLGLPL